MDFRKTVIQTLLFVSILKVSLSFGYGIFSSVFVNFSAPMATFRKFACRHGLRIADRRKKESRWHTTDTAATKRAFQMITDQSISLLRFRPSHLFEEFLCKRIHNNQWQC